MDQNASVALLMVFGIFVFVIALSLSMYMLRTITYTAETLTYFSDTTRYYDNVEIDPYKILEYYTQIDAGDIAKNKYNIELDTATGNGVNMVTGHPIYHGAGDIITVTVQGRLTTITYADGDVVSVDPIGSESILQKCAAEYMQKNNLIFSERLVSAETIVPVLYRYDKENFCVKIYGYESDDTHPLIQLFDVNIEGKVSKAYKDTTLGGVIEDYQKKVAKGYLDTYNNEIAYNNGTGTGDRAYVYMFSVPWLGKPECVKERVSLFVNGDAGYINDVYVDYKDNKFFQARQAMRTFRETFVSYSYDGSTYTSDEGDEFVDGGTASKDKIVIIYTQIEKNT